MAMNDEQRAEVAAKIAAVRDRIQIEQIRKTERQALDHLAALVIAQDEEAEEIEAHRALVERWAARQLAAAQAKAQRGLAVQEAERKRTRALWWALGVLLAAVLAQAQQMRRDERDQPSSRFL